MNQPSNIQLQAIKHLSGPAQIIAGPGSGKTFTIIKRILYLTEHHHITPEQILVITFTKAAALEMKERYDAAISLIKHNSGFVNFGTFHSICYHILQESGACTPNSLIKETDKRKILEIILRNHGYGEKANYEVISDILSQISKRKNLTNDPSENKTPKCRKSVGAAEYQTKSNMPDCRKSSGTEKQQTCNNTPEYRKCADAEKHQTKSNTSKCRKEGCAAEYQTEKYVPECHKNGNPMENEQTVDEKMLTDRPIFSDAEICMFQKEYQLQLQERNKLDFDDMIGMCLHLLLKKPDLLAKYQKRFRFILVDEFQDINMPQYAVIRLLAGKEANLFVVGDDDQAIYGFRGSSPGIMKQFLTDYPDSVQIMLTENYRCAENIVLLSEKVISRNTERFHKEFYPVRKSGRIEYLCMESRKQEEEALIASVKQLTEEKRNRSAVILRTNREVFLYKELLRTAGIAIGEKQRDLTDIFHGFLIEDITAYLKFLYEGEKRSDFIKFMNKPEHYFTRLSLLEETVTKEGMKSYYAKNPEMKNRIDQFFRQLSLAAGLSPYMAVSFYRKSIGYERYLKEKCINRQEYQQALDTLDKLQDLLKNCKGKIRVEEFFKTEAESRSNGSAGWMQRKGISVITMHAAKGLEFEHVFLPDINEGVIPGKNCKELKEREEERRLLYVAITRAKEHLHIYCTKERNRTPSSFLQGIILPQ